MKIRSFALLLSCTSFTMPAIAQDAVDAEVLPATSEVSKDDGAIIVTGSRIKRDPNNSSLPVQILNTKDFERNGISSPEQLVSFLTTNGTAADNLAANSDVVGGTQRGNNGLSAANLRGQGSGATLVLLNNRRVAAHGLNGSAVDVNQIPFAAIERVEILKDGASAIYGTDAIGGVMNFITKTNYTGITLNGFTDITQKGDAPIYRLSGLAGYGDLDTNGFNVMASISYSTNGSLSARNRDFVNTLQPDRGLSPETRGAPFANIGPLAGSLFPSAGTAPLYPGGTVRAQWVNILALPGQAGCEANPLQAPYQADLWGQPGRRLACTYDTGKAATLQQELSTLTWFGRGLLQLGESQLSFEVTGSDADSRKNFSELQLAPNTSTQRFFYPRNAITAPVYDNITQQLRNYFSADAGLAARIASGTPIAYRWRCLECGRREISTNVKTQRYALGIEGPFVAGWDYRAGASYSSSKAFSILGDGYFYRGTNDDGTNDPNAPTAPGASAPGIVGALNSGVINPFLFPGQTQSAAAFAQLAAVSAKGVRLFGGKYATTQIDGSVSGELFDLPGGAVKAALGFDYRRETYGFSGDARPASARPVIIAAPFDDPSDELNGIKREVKAAYAEVLIPIFEGFEATAAGRFDKYDGFGTTFNPKFDAKYSPSDWLLFRGSYNSGFQIPTFNQLFNAQSSSPYTGSDLADPRDCANGVVDLSKPLCSPLTPNIIEGGKPTLKPQTAKQYSVGVVVRPTSQIVASVDFWSITRENDIKVADLTTLLQNYSLFADSFIRNSTGALIAIDQTYINSGGTKTDAIEVSARYNGDLGNLSLNVGIDGTYLITKKQKILANESYGASQIGVDSIANDLGLRWKHNAYVNIGSDNWDLTLTQLFRSGYANRIYSGIASGAFIAPNYSPKVKPYIVYNLAASINVDKRFRITSGIRNLFDTDPPFALTYDDNLGVGSSWDPRVADPRGRSFTLALEVKF